MAQTAAAKPTSAERPSLTLTRRFRARPEKVWAAWTDPEKLIAWFCTTKAKPGSFRAELDVRVGGRYRISFDMESGEYSEVGGIYREVSLRAVPEIYIENIFAKPADVLHDGRRVEVKCYLNRQPEKPLTLKVELRDGDRVLASQ